MANPLQIRYVVGVSTSLGFLPIVNGNYTFDLSVNELIFQTNNNLRKVNRNVIKTSLIIPANEIF